MQKGPDIPQMEELMAKSQEAFKYVRLEFLSRVVTIIIAGLALITALAWDETFKDIFAHFFGEITTLEQKLKYAALITLFAIVVSFIVSKIFLNKNKNK